MMGNAQSHHSHASPFSILKWTIYFSVPTMLWAGVNFQTLREYFQASAKLDQNFVEVGKLEKEYAELQKEREMLDLGGFPAEKAIRERFKMVLPGENVIFFESEGDGTAVRPVDIPSQSPADDAATTRTATLRSLTSAPAVPVN